MIVFKELEVIGGISPVIADYRHTIQFIRNNRKKHPLTDIIITRYTLERASEAIAAMEIGKEIKPVIVP